MLDDVVGGNGGSRGGGNPPPPNVTFGLQVSGSLGPFSVGGTLTTKGFYPSAGGGAGGGGPVDVVMIVPTRATPRDVLTGASVDGSAHGGVGVTGSVGSDGYVIGLGVGAGGNGRRQLRDRHARADRRGPAEHPGRSGGVRAMNNWRARELHRERAAQHRDGGRRAGGHGGLAKPQHHHERGRHEPGVSQARRRSWSDDYLT